MRYFVVHLHRLLEPDAKRGRADDLDQPRRWPSAAGAKKPRNAGALKSVLEEGRASRWRSRASPRARSPRCWRSGCGFVRLTNPLAKGSADLDQGERGTGAGDRRALARPASAGAGRLSARAQAWSAMVSRSADAELNALVVGEVRPRGGARLGRREVGKRHLDKGGARALIALKKALDAGKNVCMIADIPHGTPRQAGMGIVTLARLSGRPIVPVAIATSRRKVLEKSWDKTTINLPFGRCAVVVGEPVHVAGRRRRGRDGAEAPGTDRRAQRGDRPRPIASSTARDERTLGAHGAVDLSAGGRRRLSADRHLCRLARHQGQGRPQPPPRALRLGRPGRARTGR